MAVGLFWIVGRDDRIDARAFDLFQKEEVDLGSVPKVCIFSIVDSVCDAASKLLPFKGRIQVGMVSNLVPSRFDFYWWSRHKCL